MGELVFHEIGNAHHCNMKDKELIAKANTFPKLARVAIRVARSMAAAGPVIQVCGKISTGGGTIEENSARIGRAIMVLRGQGKTVFSQLQFQKQMIAIKKSRYYEGPQQLLEEFYGPLFREAIHELKFLHDWRDSSGARWEYGTGVKLKIPREILPKDFEFQPLRTLEPVSV